MNECGGRCCGERAESLPRDGAGRRGGEGDEGLGEKWSAFKHLSELAVLRRGCPLQGSAGHCLAGRWPSGAPRNAPTPAMSLKKSGGGGRDPLYCYCGCCSPSLPASQAALRGARISLQPALPAGSAASPRLPLATRGPAPPAHGAPPPARALTGARRCRARPEPRRRGPAALPAPQRPEGGKEERRGSSRPSCV